MSISDRHIAKQKWAAEQHKTQNYRFVDFAAKSQEN
jgi:hypothetical protein